METITHFFSLSVGRRCLAQRFDVCYHQLPLSLAILNTTKPMCPAYTLIKTSMSLFGSALRLNTGSEISGAAVGADTTSLIANGTVKNVQSISMAAIMLTSVKEPAATIASYAYYQGVTRKTTANFHYYRI
jgi:hypothetical protein